MKCYCCNANMEIARKVKIRPIVESTNDYTGPDDPRYVFYRKEMTFRWAVVCPGCYLTLDNYYGKADFGDKTFSLAGQSRGDKAATINEEKYQKWQAKEAAKLGL